MNTDLQKLRELGYDGIADEIEDGFKRWDKRMIARSIAESYLGGKFKLHINLFFRVNGDDGITRKYRVGYKCPIVNLQRGAGKSSEIDALIYDDSNTEIGSRKKSQFAMLVEPVELMELPERMGGVIDTQMIWLKTLNEGCGDRIDATDFPFLHIGGHRLFAENRELRSLLLLVSHGGREFFCQGESHVIQGGSQVIKNVSKDQFENDWDFRNAFEAAYNGEGNTTAAREVRQIGIWIVNDSTRVFFGPGIGFILEGFNVVPSPVDF